VNASRSVFALALDLELDPAKAQPIAGSGMSLLDSFAVDERAVRAREILDLETLVARRETAVQPGDERRVEDEVRSVRASDSSRGSTRETERRSLIV